MSVEPEVSAEEARTMLSLPSVLDRAHQAVADVLVGLQTTRVALEGARTAAVGRLETTHAKLREVTSTTEGATSEILDALDRAQALIDTLDAEAEAPVPDAARAQETRRALREELFGMMTALQFQDITTQQISHSASMLTELEQRLASIVALFDGTRLGLEDRLSTAAPALHFAPGATMKDAEQRQLDADLLFVSQKAS
jgi:chemotaxis regulatin CheY-phosphate phosphatase CheZ